MPNRVLRDWTDSEKVNKLSEGAEVFFVRLFMKADDHGGYHANIKILRSHLYPMKIDSVSEKKIAGWLSELVLADLIRIFWHKGKEYLHINNFGQRTRIMREKYPLPQSADGCQTDDGHMTDICPPETETERKPKQETEKSFLIFETFRQLYPGTKRGSETEFENLKKKHKDWKDIVFILPQVIEHQIIYRNALKAQGAFVPEWKNLSTWVNQRCWEEEIKTPTKTKYEDLPRDRNGYVIHEQKSTNTWF